LEPITHFLTGACLGRAFFNRKTALATATVTLAAEAPDLDVLANFRGPVFGFAHHRGFTHSFLGLIITSAVVVGFMYLVWVIRGRQNNKYGLAPRWGLLFLFAYIAGLTHILLDFTNNYGVRPFWPFSEQWYSWDIVFIVDPYILALLVIGLVAPAFLALVDSDMGVRRKTPPGRWGAMFALFLILVFWGVRDFQHRRAVNSLQARTYESEAPLRASAYPMWWTPFQWVGVVETQRAYANMTVDSSNSDVDPDASMQVHYKPEETPITLAAKQSYLGRVYLDWAKYPITETEPLDSGYLVRFHDERFNYREMGRSVLSAQVELNQNLHVVAEQFGMRKQKLPD
jgi:inner membrane protein